MYIGSNIRPTGYSPGELITSVQRRRMRGIATDITLKVGNECCIPEDLQVLCLTEAIPGQCYIDRYFLLFQRQMFPIYLRLTNMVVTEYSSVLLCNQGISEFFRQLHGTSNKNTLLKNVLLECVVDELQQVDPGTADMLRDVPLDKEIDRSLGNDIAENLPEKNGELSAGYPWNVVNQLNPAINCWLTPSIENQHVKYANYLSDLALSVSPMEGVIHPVSVEVTEYLSPQVPSGYLTFAFDPLTTLMAAEQTLPKREVMCRLMTPKFIPMQFCQLPDRAKYEKPLVLSSNILEFCVWVHTLPYLECGGKYILPTKTTPEKFVWTVKDRREEVQSPIQSYLVGDLQRICQFWDPQLLAIEFLKSRYDELFVHFTFANGERKMYFDLAVTSVLSQAIAQLD